MDRKFGNFHENGKICIASQTQVVNNILVFLKGSSKC